MTFDPTPRCRRCGKVCPKLPEQSWEEWEAMRYCDDVCHHALARQRAAALVEDVEFMIGTGCGWAEICRRLGRNPAATAKALDRAGRYDLIVAAGIPKTVAYPRARAA